MAFNEKYDRPISYLYLFTVFPNQQAAQAARKQSAPSEFRPEQDWIDPQAMPGDYSNRQYPASFNEASQVYNTNPYQFPAYLCMTTNIGSSKHTIAPVPCRLPTPTEKIMHRATPWDPDPEIWVRDLTAYAAANAGDPPPQTAPTGGPATLESIQATANEILAKLK